MIRNNKASNFWLQISYKCIDIDVKNDDYFPASKLDLCMRFQFTAI